MSQQTEIEPHRRGRWANFKKVESFGPRVDRIWRGWFGKLLQVPLLVTLGRLKLLDLGVFEMWLGSSIMSYVAMVTLSNAPAVAWLFPYTAAWFGVTLGLCPGVPLLATVFIALRFTAEATWALVRDLMHSVFLVWYAARRSGGVVARGVFQQAAEWGETIIQWAEELEERGRLRRERRSWEHGRRAAAERYVEQRVGRMLSSRLIARTWLQRAGPRAGRIEDVLRQTLDDLEDAVQQYVDLEINQREFEEQSICVVEDLEEEIVREMMKNHDRSTRAFHRAHPVGEFDPY